MKRYTSKFLKTIAVLYMAFPASYLAACALLFDIPANKYASILLSPTYYILSLMAVAVGYGLWEMKRWSWYLFLVVNVLVTYNSAVLAAEHGESHHRAAAFLISGLFIIFLIYRVGREVRVPYFLPKIRWWESDPRYRLSVRVSVRRTSGELMEGEILDLSMGGCFVKLRSELLDDETVTLQFNIFGQPLDCAGTVVWRTQSAVTHPKGVGVKFAPMHKPQRRIFKSVNQRLKEISTLYKTSRYLMSQEEFFKKMERLQTQNLPSKKRAKA